MAQMPVSTLRIWEQRYQAIGPTTAASGQRLYSAADVERVLLLRQLTEQGHAISAIASLKQAQLQRMAAVHAGSGGGGRVLPARRSPALRLAVVGGALALRLQRPAVARHLARRWQVVAVFESLADAAVARSAASVDLLLWQAPTLQDSTLPELKAAQAACRARQVAVSYRFAGAAARSALARTGAEVAREPADDDALGAWLASLEVGLVEAAASPRNKAARFSSPKLAQNDVAPRRFDDAALTAFASLSSTVACECPRHVAELLMQLSNFETYSAQCADRNQADAELHAYLRQVAGRSRALFEAALERVAAAEGLALP